MENTPSPLNNYSQNIFKFKILPCLPTISATCSLLGTSTESVECRGPNRASNCCGAIKPGEQGEPKVFVSNSADCWGGKNL